MIASPSGVISRKLMGLQAWTNPTQEIGFWCDQERQVRGSGRMYWLFHPFLCPNTSVVRIPHFQFHWVVRRWLGWSGWLCGKSDVWSGCLRSHRRAYQWIYWSLRLETTPPKWWFHEEKICADNMASRLCVHWNHCWFGADHGEETRLFPEEATILCTGSRRVGNCCDRRYPRIGRICFGLGSWASLYGSGLGLFGISNYQEYSRRMEWKHPWVPRWWWVSLRGKKSFEVRSTSACPRSYPCLCVYP